MYFNIIKGNMDVETKTIPYPEETFSPKNNPVRKDIAPCPVLFSFGPTTEPTREKK